MLPEPLGQRICRCRIRAGLNQVDLAVAMQEHGHHTITRQRIGEIENGRREVTAVELVTMARVLGVPITELLGVPDHAPLE